MDAIGIIAEYNPFHNGHDYQLAQIRRENPSAPVVAVMSGYFTQRGEPAIATKWERAAWAVAGGVDLVVELPTAFAIRSAQAFAAGGITLLSRLGCVDTVAFGAECEDLNLLEKIAAATDAENNQAALRQRLKNGVSYAAALGQLLAEAVPAATPDVLNAPNNILAVQYIRANSRLAAPLNLRLIPRRRAAYHQTAIDGAIASAAAVRRNLYENGDDWRQAVPTATVENLAKLQDENILPDKERLFAPLMARLLTEIAPELAKFHGVSEGLEYLLLRAAENPAVNSLRELADALKSKRYPYTRLNRLFLALLLGLTREFAAAADTSGPLYGRILAANETGRQLIRRIKAATDFPLVTQGATMLPRRSRQSGNLTAAEKMLALDMRAAGLYALNFSRRDVVPTDAAARPKML